MQSLKYTRVNQELYAKTSKMNTTVGKLEEKVRYMEGDFGEGIQTQKRNKTEINMKETTK